MLQVESFPLLLNQDSYYCYCQYRDLRQLFYLQTTKERAGIPSLSEESRLSNCDCLQVHDRRASLFLDGLEEDGTPFDTQPLTTRLSDSAEDGAMWVGASSDGKYACLRVEKQE